jgi:hypothetical protein
VSATLEPLGAFAMHQNINGVAACPDGGIIFVSQQDAR